jgi:hypothetical protein
MTLPQRLGSIPKYEIRNLLAETFHGTSELLGQGHQVKQIKVF